MAIKTQLMGALAVLIIAITIAPDHCVKGALIEANVNVSVTLQTSLLNIRNSGVAGVFYALNDLLTYAVLTLQVELALVAQLLVSALGGLLGQVLALLGYVLAADCPQPTDCSPDCDQIDCNQIASCAQDKDCSPLLTCKPTGVTEDDPVNIDMQLSMAPMAVILADLSKFDRDGVGGNDITEIGLLFYQPNNRSYDAVFSLTLNDRLSDPRPLFFIHEVVKLDYGVYAFASRNSNLPCTFLLIFLGNIQDEDCGVISLLYFCVQESQGCFSADFDRGSGDVVVAVVYQQEGIVVTDACRRKAKEAVDGLKDEGFDIDPDSMTQLGVDLTSHLCKFDYVTYMPYTNPNARGLNFTTVTQDGRGIYDEVLITPDGLVLLT